MITLHETYRIKADSTASLAKMLYHHVSFVLEPILCYVPSAGWFVAVAKRERPGPEWGPIEHEGVIVAWKLPVFGEF